MLFCEGIRSGVGYSNLDNATIVHENVVSLLLKAFPNLNKHVIISFVTECFDIHKDIEAFKQHIRDFLIRVKEFELEDNSGILHSSMLSIACFLTSYVLRRLVFG